MKSSRRPRKDVPEGWLQVARYTAAEPTSWDRKAHCLRKAAGLLWDAGNEGRIATTGPKPQTLVSWEREGFEAPKMGGGQESEVCFMLLGFALENLAKGILVCRDPSLVSRKRLRGWHTDSQSGHDLVLLFDRCKIAVSEPERRLLARTTRLIVWRGRYPIPMNFYDIDPGRDPLTGQLAIGEGPLEDDFNGLQALYERVDAALRKTMEETPPLSADYDFGD